MSVIAEKLRRLVGGSPTAGTRVQAVWHGTVIAESDRTEVVEGNHYFPPEDVRRGHLAQSTHQTVCPWKGTASYYDLVVDGDRNPAAAWYYPRPKTAAARIKDHVAFWHGVTVRAAEGS
jgi:uncharacterized protein (DUF427 family)